MNTSLSLLFINYEYPPIGGGGGATSKFLAEALVRRGHRVHVLTGALKGEAGTENPAPGLVVERLHTGRTRGDMCTVREMARFVWAAGWRLRHMLREGKPDIIHVFFSLPTGAVLLFTNLRRVQPYCISLLGGDVPGFLPAETGRMHTLLMGLTRRLWREAAAVLPNSEGLASLARKTLDRKYDVISNGVNTSLFNSEGACDNEGQLRLVFVGRLVPQKGLDVLLDALALLQDTCEYSLTVIGDGLQREQMMSLAQTHGLAKRVTWKGWQQLDDLRDLYGQHHVLILPSRFEGMASVMLQAMACGCAVVSTDVFGAHDVLGDGAGGYVVPIDDRAALAASISKFFDLNQREQLRSGAVKKASEFSWDALAKHTETLYYTHIAQEPNTRG